MKKPDDNIPAPDQPFHAKAEGTKKGRPNRCQRRSNYAERQGCKARAYATRNGQPMPVPN
jgi:hypothetical protein